MAERNFTCKRCNRVFVHTSPTKRYCSECIELQKKEQLRKFRDKKSKPTYYLTIIKVYLPLIHDFYNIETKNL